MSDYLDRFLSKLEGVQDRHDGWLALCPVFGHGEDLQDERPSLRVTVGENGRILVRCRVGCSTEEVLSSLGLAWRDLWPAGGELPAEVRAGNPVDYLTPDEVSFRHQVYNSLLSRLWLEPEDRQNLLARGLDDVEISLGRYRSLKLEQLGSLAYILWDEYQEKLYEVPGFEKGPLGPRLPEHCQGLLIPVLNKQYQIVAIKVRRPDSLGDPRYCYLSWPENSSGAPAHFPPGCVSFDGPLILTEGEIKAHVIQYRLRHPCISVPGVALWARALEAVEELAPQVVHLAFDWPDVLTKEPVRQAFRECREALLSRVPTVRTFCWEGPHKGLDDLLVTGKEPDLIEGDPLPGNLATVLEVPGDDDGPVPVPPAAFPTDVFPPAVVDFIHTVARSLPCPEDFPGVAALAVASVAIGTSRKVRVKPGWSEFCNLFAAVVSPPGALKSPALDLIVRPVFSIEEDLEAAFEEVQAAYDDRLDEYKAKRSAYQKALAAFYKDGSPLTESMPEKPERPHCEHMYSDDATIEALAEMLRSSPRGLLNFHDELVSWVRGMNQYRSGKGTDRQFYLKAWQCAKVKVVRKSELDRPLRLKQPFISVLGSIQPTMLEELGDSRGREDGFLARMLFSWPHTNPAPDFDFSTDIPDQQAQQWESIIRYLRSLTWDDPEKHRPVFLYLDSEAQAMFTSWHDKHREEVQHPDFPENLQATWSKMKAYCIRFAGILHLLDLISGSTMDSEVICSGVIERSVQLVDYFKDHTRRVFDRLNFDPYEKPIREFKSWMKAQGRRQIELREFYRKHRWGIKGKDSALKLLKVIVDRGEGYFEGERNHRNQEKKVFKLLTWD